MGRCVAGWLPPFEPRLVFITLPETLPSLPIEFVGTCSRMPLRDDLPAGFTAAVQGFEEWCQLLLLDAVQRFGFFQTANEVCNFIGLDICASSCIRGQYC